MKNLIFALTALLVFTSLQTWSQQEGRQDYHYPSDNADTEIYLLQRLILFNKGYKRALADHGSEAIRVTYEDNNTDFVNRMIKLKDKMKTRTQKKAYSTLMSDSAVLNPDLVKEITAGKTRTYTPTELARVAVAPAAVAPTPVAASNIQRKTHSGVVYTDKITCINGGFPLEYEPCLPVIVLPEEYGLAELNEHAASFNCEQPKQMCNPFITGYREECFTDPNSKKKKCVPDPVCVSGEDNTTIACLKASDKESSKKQVISIWQNPKNKFAYDYTKKALNEFCKPEYVSGQSKASCQALQERFDEIRAKAWPTTGQPPPSATPARR